MNINVVWELKETDFNYDKSTEANWIPADYTGQDSLDMLQVCLEHNKGKLTLIPSS